MGHPPFAEKHLLMCSAIPAAGACAAAAGAGVPPSPAVQSAPAHRGGVLPVRGGPGDGADPGAARLPAHHGRHHVPVSPAAAPPVHRC